MDALTLNQIALAIAILLGLHTVVIVPWLRKRLAASANSAKPRWAAAVLVFQTSQVMSLAALILAGLTLIVLSFMTSSSGTSLAAVAQTLARLRSLHQFINETRLAIWLWALAFASVTLWYWIVHQRRSRFTARTQDQFNRLHEQPKQGMLRPREPSPEMKLLIEQIKGIDARTRELNHGLGVAANDGDRNNLRTQLADLDASRKTTIETIISVDLARRIDAPPYVDLIGDPTPDRTSWQKVVRFFVPWAMLRQLNPGQWGLLLLNILLVVPSMLTLCGPRLVADLDSRIARLDELRVSLISQETEQRFETASSARAPAPDAADTVDDPTFSNIAYSHAKAFEGALSRNFEQHFPAPAAAIGRPRRNPQTVLREEDARRRILLATARRTNSAYPAGPSSPPSGRDVEVHGLAVGTVQLPTPALDIPDHPVQLSDLARRVALIAADPMPHALTPAGESLAREIIERGKTDAGFRQLIVASFRSAGASFFEAARPSQLRGIFLTGALGGSAETAVISDVLAQPAAQWAIESMAAIEPGFSARVYQTYSREYLATLFETWQASRAIRAVESAPQDYLLHTEIDTVRTNLAANIRSDAAVVGELQQFPVGLVEMHDGLTNRNAENAALTRFYEDVNSRREAPVELRERIAAAPAKATFETYFPSEPTSRSTAAQVVRARSFVRSSFSSFGGGMIGRNPEKGTLLDIHKLRWEQQGQYIKLILTDSAGHDIALAPVEQSIINLALAYAADGRVLTNTMTTAEPLQELHILQHPVLVDTPLGCRAIAIDRFVDETVPTENNDTKELEPRGMISVLVADQQAAYAAARGALLQAALDDPETSGALSDKLGWPEASIVIRFFRESISDEAKRYVRLNEVAKLDAKLLLDPKYSPLRVKKEFFDSRIVDLIEACALGDQSADQFEACLATNAKAKLAQRNSLVRDINWTAPTPTFRLWSGVRELPYELDPHFAFAGSGASATDAPPQPFQFMIQVSFTSYPYATAKEPWYKIKEDTVADDSDPWLFPDPDVPITANVVRAIEASPERQDIFNGMRKFVWFERLFRAGLSGNLGADFPVEKLAELGEQTATAVPRERTWRWNVRTPPELHLLFKLVKDTKDMSDAGRANAVACLRAVGIDASGVDVGDHNAVAKAVGAAATKLYDISDEQWDKVCRFTPASSLSTELVTDSSLTADMRALRNAFGLRAEDKFAEAYKGCGPL
jgi:hypothetical protein